MTLDDLEKEFWGGEREQPARVRLARVVKALRDEMSANWNAHEDAVELLNEILGGLDAEGEAAGGPVRKEGTEAIAADPGARGTTPAADLVQRVAEAIDPWAWQDVGGGKLSNIPAAIYQRAASLKRAPDAIQVVAKWLDEQPLETGHETYDMATAKLFLLLERGQE